MYICSITVFYNSVEEHIYHSADVLRFLAGTNVLLNFSSCKFFYTTTTFSGHDVKTSKIGIEARATKSLGEDLLLRNKLEQSSFLDFVTSTHELFSALHISLAHSMKGNEKSLKNPLTTLLWATRLVLDYHPHIDVCPYILFTSAKPAEFFWHRCLGLSDMLRTVLNKRGKHPLKDWKT